MTVLAPLAALALLAIPVIVLIHYLRGSRRRLRLPSVELWEGLAPGLTARNRVRRPPLSLLLLLQLLIAGGLAAALMRPAVEGEPIGHLGLVLDASASMQATDVAPTRFEAARSAARQRLQSLAREDQVTLVRAGHRPTIEFQGPARDAEQALQKLAAGAGTARLDDALMLLTTELGRTPDLRGSVVVLTDAAIDTSAPLSAGALPLEVVTVGGSGGNQAIVDLSARVEPGARAIDVFAEIANFEARPVRVTVQLSVDDLPLATKQLDVAAQGRAPTTISVPLESGRITARLNGRDALPLDDVAEMALPSLRPRNVVLVSDGPSAMERALRAVPGVRLTQVTPDEFVPNNADLTVFDAVRPDPMPTGPVLLVHPPPDNGVVLVNGDLRLPPVTSVDATHPMLAGIDLNALRFNRADRIVAPAWAHNVLGSPRGPLIVEGVWEGQAFVVFAFDPVMSGFEKSIGFPVLVGNTVSSTLARLTGPSVRPGQVVTIPSPADGRPAVIIRPDGNREQLASAAPGALYDRTDQIGRYSIQDSTAQRTTRTFAVNLLNPFESDTNPRSLAAPAPIGPAEGDWKRATTEWWWPVVAAAVLFLCLEWLVFARRG